MNLGWSSLLLLMVFLCSVGGVAAVRKYALRRLLDLPNERNSHTGATPRGGGLGLAVSHLFGMTAASLIGAVPWDIAIALIGGGALVAGIGFLDDHVHVPPLLRLLCHFCAFGWAVAWLGGLPPVDLGWGALDLGWIGTCLMVVLLTWFLNLFNFMDGIDGVAGAQTVTMAATSSALLTLLTDTVENPLPGLILVAASMGFLAWNWPPAKIFMGDVGSGYVGYVLGVLALSTIASGFLSPWVWLILGGCFIADATVTLFVRWKGRASLTQAHRSHAYQRLSRHWGAHRSVTLLVVAVNVFWLCPWAIAATRWPALGFTCSVCALLPVIVAVVKLGAGRSGEIADSRSRRYPAS